MKFLGQKYYVSLESLATRKKKQENLAGKILWKFLTAGHLVHLRPCLAAGHLDTVLKNTVRLKNVIFFHKL